ncbi:MAG TPA: hypothetical protein VFU14_16765 [Acidimicrobiales bacterium]|nr:hypothetical protein [Acidimicrobiales bacterium]
MKAGEEPEPVDEGGDPACWLHEFEDELLGEVPEDDEADARE